MKLGMTLYIQNSNEAVELYKEAFGFTLGDDNVKFPDGTYMHAPLCKDGEEIFAISEAPNGALVKAIHETASNKIIPIASHGIDFDTEEELKKAYEILTKEGIIIRPLGPLPWDTCSADIVDKFGVCWYLLKW